MYSTTMIPRLLVHMVMQDVYQQQQEPQVGVRFHYGKLIKPLLSLGLLTD